MRVAFYCVTSEVMNRVLSTKLWWRWVTNKGEPWAQLWHQKYCKEWKNVSLICWDENNPGSPIWKALNANRSLVKDYSFWEVGNGEGANFFRDSWYEMPKLQDKITMSALQETLGRNGIQKIKDFWSPNVTASPFRQWQTERWFKDRSPNEDPYNLIQELKERKIEIREDPDQIRWGFKALGQFNVKEVMELSSGATLLSKEKNGAASRAWPTGRR